MTREIKFRAWNIKEKQMLDVITLSRYYSNIKMVIVWVGNLFKSPIPPTCQYGISEDNEKNFILMQFTGLKDKNGKEIYEGDIVMFDLVSTNDDEVSGYGISGKVECHNLGKLTFDGWKSGYCINKKVVGNIHENPELIK